MRTRTRSLRLSCLNARSAFGSADMASDGERERPRVSRRNRGDFSRWMFCRRSRRTQPRRLVGRRSRLRFWGFRPPRQERPKSDHNASHERFLRRLGSRTLLRSRVPLRRAPLRRAHLSIDHRSRAFLAPRPTPDPPASPAPGTSSAFASPDCFSGLRYPSVGPARIR